MRGYRSDESTEPAYAGQAARLCSLGNTLRVRTGLLQRPPRTLRYELTPYGRRVALFLTKLRARLLRPALQAADPDLLLATPPPVRLAFDQLDAALDAMLDTARLAA